MTKADFEIRKAYRERGGADTDYPSFAHQALRRAVIAAGGQFASVESLQLESKGVYLGIAPWNDSDVDLVQELLESRHREDRALLVIFDVDDVMRLGPESKLRKALIGLAQEPFLVVYESDFIRACEGPEAVKQVTRRFAG